MPLLLMVLAVATSIALPHWAIRWDERRLSAEQRSRCYNAATHWSAVVAFNWIAVWVHFVRTRRGARGILLGLLWSSVGLFAQSVLLGVLQVLD